MQTGQDGVDGDEEPTAVAVVVAAAAGSLESNGRNP